MLKDIDKKILNRIQDGFPISKRPFLKLAQELNLKENELLGRLKGLSDAKLIRRIGAILNFHRLGLVSSLVAMKVPENKIDKIAKLVSSLKEVTHNYKRKDKYNLWFVLHTKTVRDRQRILSWLKKKTGINDIKNLATEKSYKLKVKFKL